MKGITSFLEESAIKYPNKAAFTFMDKTLTYKEVNASANQVANGLINNGIKKGDKISLSCLNLPYFPIIYYGILKAGGVVVPLSVLLKAEEVQYHLTDSDSVAYFCFEGTPDLPMGERGYDGFRKSEKCTSFFEIKANPGDDTSYTNASTFTNLVKGMSTDFTSEEVSKDDTAVIIYTSGTTGRPKGAELTHNNLLTNTKACKEFLTTNENDTQIIVLPLFHIFAMTVLMNTGILSGAHSILLPRFDTKTVFALMLKYKISIFAGVPTMYWALINDLDDSVNVSEISKNLKIAVSGGASLPIEVLNNFEEKFNVKILEGYGMSEGSPVVTFNQLNVGTKPGSVGTVIDGVEVKLIDADGNEVPVGERGELLYKGLNVMKGYYNKPKENEETLAGGWMHSGDIAIKDEDGFYFIVDRKKDMIIRGGLNVYPREVEEVMIQHKKVSLVAVIGVPSEKLGEEVKAYVILNEGQTITESDLKAWVKSKIADYKYPRNIEFVTELPMSATGKILKKELRK